jgi:energy-coupling factor transport system ATP-binding protein
MIRLEGVRLEAPMPAAGSRPDLLLDGVDLYIRASEYVVLCGPNGAGKSLLLQLMAGLRHPSAGSVTCDDPDLSIALVFQSPDDQIVGSTVERDLAFGLENRGLPPEEIRAQVREALVWSGLEPLAGRPPHLLSEGEKQRLALTSALVLRPALLLLDEPTSRLGPPARRRFLEGVLQARTATGAAVVHVTHRSEEVVAADRVVGMEAGRVVFEGTPEELVGSEAADRLGIRWSGLHRLRRALRARGAAKRVPAGTEWNVPDALAAEVRK